MRTIASCFRRDLRVALPSSRARRCPVIPHVWWTWPSRPRFHLRFVLVDMLWGSRFARVLIYHRPSVFLGGFPFPLHEALGFPRSEV